VLLSQQCGELCQPGWRLQCQDADNGLASGAVGEFAKRLQHRIVGFLAPISLDALTVHDAQAGSLGVTLKLVDQRGLPDPGFAGNEYDLTFSLQRFSQCSVQLG
jgi:hypothetical protein